MAAKKEVIHIHKASIDVAFKCGECLHHKTHKHTSFKEVCSKLGVRNFATAPNCFTPDVTKLCDNSDSFVQLAAMLHTYDASQKRILLSLLRQKPIKGRAFSRDLPFGTKVFFLAFGKDYISNYLSGYVMGLTSAGELIVSGSPEQNTRGRSYMAYMSDDNNIMTAREWRVKKQQLKDAGHVYDPTQKLMPKADVNEDPVTIDSAPDSWYDKHEARAGGDRRRGNRRTADVVTIIS